MGALPMWLEVWADGKAIHHSIDWTAVPRVGELVMLPDSSKMIVTQVVWSIPTFKEHRVVLMCDRRPE